MKGTDVGFVRLYAAFTELIKRDHKGNFGYIRRFENPKRFMRSLFIILPFDVYNPTKLRGT
jgi:hypothetical protein